MNFSSQWGDVCATSKLGMTGSDVSGEKIDFFGEAYWLGHDDRQEKVVQKPKDELVISRRFTCHEIPYSTAKRNKESNATRKSICCLGSVDFSLTVRRNSKNTSERACLNSRRACNNKLTEIHAPTLPERQDVFTEVELVDCDSRSKDTPNNPVRCETRGSLKQSSEMVNDKRSILDSSTVTAHSMDPVASNHVVDKPTLPPRQLLAQEASSSHSRNFSSISAEPRSVHSSNSSQPSRVEASAPSESLPAYNAPKSGNNSPSNSGNATSMRMPPTLQDTLVNYLVRRLGVAVWNWREDNARSIEAFISSFRLAVPAHIRSLMLERVQQEGRVWHTVTLRLLQLLLAEDCCRRVKVWQVRVFFREQFLACLTPLSRLTVLRVEDPTWRPKPQQEALLCAALPRLQQLQVLSLHYLASDAVVAAAVDNCHRLQVLDVFFSNSVTNNGAHWLLGCRDVSVQTSCSPIRPQRRKRWYSCAVSWFRRAPGKRRKLKRESRIGVPCGRHSCKGQEKLLPRSGPSNSAPVSSMASLVPDVGTTADTQASSFVKLLPHLRVLDLRGTSVSRDFINEIKEAKPAMKVLAIIPEVN